MRFEVVTCKTRQKLESYILCPDLRYTNIQDTLYVILDLLQPPEIPAPQKNFIVKSEKIFQKSSNLGELKQNY